LLLKKKLTVRLENPERSKRNFPHGTKYMRANDKRYGAEPKKFFSSEQATSKHASDKTRDMPPPACGRKGSGYVRAFVAVTAAYPKDHVNRPAWKETAR
jgi:hypothetical protein